MFNNNIVDCVSNIYIHIGYSTIVLSYKYKLMRFSFSVFWPFRQTQNFCQRSRYVHVIRLHLSYCFQIVSVLWLVKFSPNPSRIPCDHAQFTNYFVHRTDTSFTVVLATLKSLFIQPTHCWISKTVGCCRSTEFELYEDVTIWYVFWTLLRCRIW